MGSGDVLRRLGSCVRVMIRSILVLITMSSPHRDFRTEHVNCERINRSAAGAVDCVCEREAGPVTENLTSFFAHCQTDSNCPNLYNENEPLTRSHGFCGLRSTWADFRRALYVQLMPSRPLSCIMMLISDVQKGEGATVMLFFDVYGVYTHPVRPIRELRAIDVRSLREHGEREAQLRIENIPQFLPRAWTWTSSRVVLSSLLLRVRSSGQRLRSLLSSSLHRFAPSILLATYERLVHKMNASSGGANYFLDTSQGQSLPVLPIPC